MRDHNPEGIVDRVWRTPDRLRALRPEAVGLLDLANELAWQAVEPTLLEQVRLRVASAMGNEPGMRRRSISAREHGLSETKISQLDDYYTAEAFSESERDCFAFAEQFVIDVGGITDADRARLGRHFTGAQVHGFVVALYVTECTQRLEVASHALLGGPVSELGHSAAAPGRRPAAESSKEIFQALHEALENYQNAVVRGTAQDLVITEMVRLRCARTHDCRICKTLRLVEARDAGADDAMTAKVDFYEKSDLDERTKIALRITDAFITRPDTLTEDLIDQARAAFSPEELAELCLDISKWSTQKIYVSLGTDAADDLPKNEEGVSFFGFSEDGSVAGFSATPEPAGRSTPA